MRYDDITIRKQIQYPPKQTTKLHFIEARWHHRDHFTSLNFLEYSKMFNLFLSTLEMSELFLEQSRKLKNFSEFCRFSEFQNLFESSCI